jgi:hypothetical protein
MNPDIRLHPIHQAAILKLERERDALKAQLAQLQAENAARARQLVETERRLRELRGDAD